MKICIPTMGNEGLDNIVGEHFGRVPTYTIIDTETNKSKVVTNTSEHMGGVGYPPELMAREGIQIMLCRGLGRRAIMMFDQLGIEVYIGASGTVKEALQMFKEGKLQKAGIGDACGQHAFRDQHHQDSGSGHCQ